jgi:hypothetical protein
VQCKSSQCITRFVEHRENAAAPSSSSSDLRVSRSVLGTGLFERSLMVNVMLLVTGAAGFIGSNLVAALNDAGRADVVVSDALRRLVVT